VREEGCIQQCAGRMVGRGSCGPAASVVTLHMPLAGQLLLLECVVLVLDDRRRIRPDCLGLADLPMWCVPCLVPWSFTVRCVPCRRCQSTGEARESIQARLHAGRLRGASASQAHGRHQREAHPRQP
jgi:hypothetical protein